MKSKSIAFALLTLVSACDLSQKRDGSASPTDKAIFTYFTSRQYLTDNANVAALSEIIASPVVALKTESFKTQGIPQLGACGSVGDGIRIPITYTKYQEIGTFTLLGLTTNESVPLNLVSNTDLLYGANQQLPRGDYNFKVGAEGQAVNFTQAITVPASSTQMILQSGEDGTAMQLPSPAVPAETDPTYTITVSRDKNLYMGFQPPDGTTYARVSIQDYTEGSDGSLSDGSVFTCYVPPDQGVFRFEQKDIEAFRPGENASITIDFVKTDFAAAVDPHVQEAMVDSMVRQIHGLVITHDSTGAQIRNHLGILKFE